MAGGVVVVAGVAGVVAWRSRTGAARPPVTARPPSPAGGGDVMWPVEVYTTVPDEVITRAGPALYIGDESGGVLALDARTGARLWRFRHKGPLAATVGMAPAVAGGRVFACLSIGLDFAVLVALDAATGRLVWRHQVTAPVLRMLLHDGLLLYATPAAVSALDTSGGAPAWTLPLRDTTAVVAAGPLAVVAHFDPAENGRRLTVLRPAEGRPVWSREFGEVSGLTPMPHGGNLLVSALRVRDTREDTDLAAYRLGDGREVWARRWRGAVSWTSVDRTALVTTDIDRLRLLDPATGAPRWTLRRHTGGGPATWLAGDLVVASMLSPGAAGDYDLLGLDRRTGRPRWTLPLPTWLIGGVVRDGVLYATTADDQNHVLAVDTASGTQLWKATAVPGSRLTLGTDLLYTYSVYDEPGGRHVHALDLATGEWVRR
ncbi:outer membrane protein assembly factor BamB family protein [Sphaerisporangium aureirubrum]|uniref:PQQ-binding-like beta-propeller repeat protein n=1 Tax=Sphaerisporangium aureirubrum TaxID=1544736 RepID=A0ABW1NHI9_9ACTN